MLEDILNIPDPNEFPSEELSVALPPPLKELAELQLGPSEEDFGT